MGFVYKQYFATNNSGLLFKRITYVELSMYLWLRQSHRVLNLALHTLRYQVLTWDQNYDNLISKFNLYEMTFERVTVPLSNDSYNLSLGRSANWPFSGTTVTHHYFHLTSLLLCCHFSTHELLRQCKFDFMKTVDTLTFQRQFLNP